MADPDSVIQLPNSSRSSRNKGSGVVATAAVATTNAVTPHRSTSKSRSKNVFSPNTSTNITAKGAIDQPERNVAITKNIPTKNDDEDVSAD